MIILTISVQSGIHNPNTTTSNTSTRSFRKSEANASTFLEILSLYRMHIDFSEKFKSVTAQYGATCSMFKWNDSFKGLRCFLVPFLYFSLSLSLFLCIFHRVLCIIVSYHYFTVSFLFPLFSFYSSVDVFLSFYILLSSLFRGVKYKIFNLALTSVIALRLDLVLVSVDYNK